jgi:2-oxo-3-(phosphooxy)propyl 3-oxoalkanoate synthase
VPTVAPALDLTTDRTLPKALVHREGVAEVLLTDLTWTGASSYAVAAHHPREHAYYADHPWAGSAVDPLALVEVVRQAQAAISHTYLGVPSGRKFVVRAMRADLSDQLDPALLSPSAVLLAEVDALDEKVVRGELRSARFDARLLVRDGERRTDVGGVVIDIAMLAAETYGFLRGAVRARGGHQEGVVDGRQGLPSSRSVARTHSRNVTVADLEHSRDGSTARLAPPFFNTSMFDHAQDHVPAMVLLEAARQLAVHRLGAEPGGDPGAWTLRSFAGEFTAFTELDPVTLLELRPLTVMADDSRGFEVDVVERGSGLTTTTLAVELVQAVTTAR